MTDGSEAVLSQAVVYAWSQWDLSQGGKANTERQVAACQHWARHNGVLIAQIYVDCGEPFSWWDQRPQGRRLMESVPELLEAGVTAVLVVSLSRIGACSAMRDRFIDALADQGMGLYSIERSEWAAPWR